MTVTKEGQVATPTDRVLGMFKFGAREYVEQFAQGCLYMNTLEHFVKIETSLPRRDSGEGASLMMRGDGGSFHIEINGKFQQIAELRGPIRYFEPNILNVNVFCMYALRESSSGILVDPKNFEFGDTFAIVLEFDEFFKRVKVAARQTNHKLEWGLVGYIDETVYEGQVGIFKKSSEFSYQSEFRIALRPGTAKAHRLDVGNLSDIVKLGCLADINNLVKMVPPGEAYLRECS